jgi:hypothetical protein
MERTVAVKKLSRLLGKNLGYQVDPRAPDRDERMAAHERLPALTEAKKKAEEAARLRREAILANDPEYQELVAAHKRTREEWSKAAGQARAHKFTVGTSSGLFFHVKAQGDSWEEVIEKVSRDLPKKETSSHS